MQFWHGFETVLLLIDCKVNRGQQSVGVVCDRRSGVVWRGVC